MVISDKYVPLQTFLLVGYDGGIFGELYSSGFIGLTPRNEPEHYNFVRQLKSLGYLESAMFAMKFSKIKDDDTSEIIFGEYNQNIIGNNPINWEKNQNPNRWLLNVTKFEYGHNIVPMHSNLFELATGERHIRMIRTDFAPIEKYMRTIYQCTYDNHNYLFYCYVDSNSLNMFLPITVSFSKTVISIPPSEYIEFGIEKETGKKIAVVQIEVYPVGTIDYNVLGTTVLRHVYSIFDMDNMRVGFAFEKKPVEPESNVGTVLAVLLPILSVILLVGGYFGYRRYKYGTWLGKATTEIVNDHALLSNNTL